MSTKTYRVVPPPSCKAIRKGTRASVSTPEKARLRSVAQVNRFNLHFGMGTRCRVWPEGRRFPSVVLFSQRPAELIDGIPAVKMCGLDDLVPLSLLDPLDPTMRWTGRSPAGSLVSGSHSDGDDWGED